MSLHSARIVSWYILTLSSVRFILSLVGVIFSRGNKFPVVVILIPQAAQLGLCSGNFPPIALCPSLHSLAGNDEKYRYNEIFVNLSESLSRTCRDFLPDTAQSYEHTSRSYELPLVPWIIGMVVFWIIVIAWLVCINICYAVDPGTSWIEKKKVDLIGRPHANGLSCHLEVAKSSSKIPIRASLQVSLISGKIDSKLFYL